MLALAVHFAVLAPLAILGLHRAWLAWTWWRSPVPVRPPDPEVWPPVTVQLPVFNERYVVRRLIEAAAKLDYPRLRIQVLDDSTDDTTDIARAAIGEAGRPIELVHRDDRAGFKAGALQAAMAGADELIAVFDADFVPDPEFLRRVVPWLADPRVGMVQARWGHLNAGSWLTAAQAVLLDAHFAIEHAARSRSGRWFNFNGTAGVWRKQAILDGGGWQSDTLTEDLDLSYRAQLAGWRFVYDDAVVAPAELPATFAAFKAQQHRWAKGSIQTARKLLGRIWRAPIPWETKVEATFHLTANLAYPLVLVLALVMPFAVGSRLWGLDLALFLAGTGSVVLFDAAAVVACGGGWRRIPAIPASMVLGAGMAVNQARAVLEGIGGRIGTFVRTPKRGDHRGAGYAVRVHGAVALELAFAGYLCLGVAWVAWQGHWWSVPFLGMFAAGFGAVSLGSIAEARGAA